MIIVGPRRPNVNGSGQRLVVGVDGSEQSLAALDWAAAEAAARRGQLTVCHVADRGVTLAVPMTPEMLADLTAEGQDVVDAAIARLTETWPGLPVQGCVRGGSPAPTLVRLAAEAGAVVVGHRGLGGFAELLLGSVSAQVAAHAPGPAVVVRPAAHPGGPVLIGVDGAHDLHPALEYGFDYAERHGRPVQVLHAFHDPTAARGGLATRLPEADHGHARQVAVDHLSEAVQPWQEKYPGVPVELFALGGPASGALVDASLGCSLLVVGRRGPGGLAGLLLGSVSQVVIRHAHSPVAVVG
jgi:nucleotide-binding universal stress UspA family protein